MDSADKIKYIFDFGESVMPKSEKFKRITSSQIAERLREILPEGCTVSVKSVLAWRDGTRTPSYINGQAIKDLVQEIMEKRLFEN